MIDQRPDNGLEIDDHSATDLGGGEDESSTENNGDDSHLHEDQKAPSFPSKEPEKREPDQN